MRLRPSSRKSVCAVLAIDSTAIPRNGDLRLVYVEPYNTVTSSGNYKYVFGSGTRLQVLTSEYYRQDGLYFKSGWCLKGKEW